MRIRVGASVLNQTPLAWAANRDNVLGAIEDARAAGVTILCLPELCLTGYNCEDVFQAPGLARTAIEVLDEVLPATRGLIVSLGLPVRHGAGLYNAAALAVDGALVGLVAKQFLAGDGIHYEPRWFRAWRRGERAEIELGRHRVPLGDLHFDCGGVKIGFEICEDAWVADRPGADLARRGVDVILNPSASHFAFDKISMRRGFVTEGSRAFAASYVYANLLGNEAGRAIYDGGALIASGGKLLATGPRLGFVDRVLTTAVIDLEVTRRARSRGPLPEPAPGDEAACVTCAYVYPAVETSAPDPPPAAWESGPHLKEEEFTRAVTLGLFDYLRKSRSRGAVVSLSGGADSAATACLVALVAHRGIAELGLEGFLARLGRTDVVATEIPGVVGELLTCVYQATAQSSETTRSAAETVARALGATYLELDVEGLVQGTIERVERGLGRELTWETDDIALQNVQARVRAPTVWMFANVLGFLLLSTSNRSEAAVGYATMDGDTCGGLSPIAGIDKAFLRTWLRWLETTGPDGFGPIPALRAVNEQAPTAELRPASAEQTDESDLMPYPILDAIERLAIRDKKMPVEVFRAMRESRPDVDRESMGVWVERFFRLWCRNQWKRERYAPSFHLDDENLDPKTWCRFPILSGGFERELDELRREIASRSGA